MEIRVVYEDGSLDMVPPYILQLGIECSKIRMFYRESERKWVTPGVDPVRRTHNGRCYDGPERRMIYSFVL
jgi:hypothetical protein